MSPLDQSPYALFKTCDLLYLKFIQQCLKVGISFFQAFLDPETTSSSQYKAEKQLHRSLTLLEKILMHAYLRNIYLKKDWYQYINTDLQEEMKKTKYLLAKMESVIIDHEFADELLKDHFKKILDELSRYFYISRIKIIIDNPEPGKPWIQPFCTINKFK